MLYAKNKKLKIQLELYIDRIAAECLFIYQVCIALKMVNYCFALPYSQGGLELAKKFAQENTNTKEHDEFYKLAGITREIVWIQRSPPGSSSPDLGRG